MVSRIELPRAPMIDLSLFDLGDPWRDQVAALVDAAASQFGFFYIVGHGIDTAVVDPLIEAGRRFFAAEDTVKRRVQVAREGRGQHGYFPLAAELHAGKSELKEALYFQAHLSADGASATSGTAVSGQGLLPEVPGIREPVLDYMRSLTGLCHKLMSMIARGLQLQDSYFVDRYTGSPSTSLGIYNYPQLAQKQAAGKNSGDADGTAHGLLTILKQDSMGGLELRYQNRWLDIPEIPNSFVCTVGAMLAQLTNGRYVAAAHRVLNSARGNRLSMPFYFDPALGAVLEPIEAIAASVPRGRLSDEMSKAVPVLGRRHLA